MLLQLDTLVTSQISSMPSEVLRLESYIQSYNTCSNPLIFRAQEKALQSSDDHLRLLTLTANIPQRLPNYCNFHRKTNDLSALFPVKPEHRQLINHFPSPPWQFIQELLVGLMTPLQTPIQSNIYCIIPWLYHIHWLTNCWRNKKWGHSSSCY